MSNVSKPDHSLVQSIARLAPELRAKILADKVVIEITIDNDCKPVWRIPSPALIEAAEEPGLKMFRDHLVAVRHPIRVDIYLINLSTDIIAEMKACCRQANELQNCVRQGPQEPGEAPGANDLEVRFKAGKIKRLRIYVSAEALRKIVEEDWEEPQALETLHIIQQEIHVSPGFRRKKSKVAFMMAFGPSDKDFGEFLFTNCLAFRRAAMKANSSPPIVKMDFLAFEACILTVKCYQHRPGRPMWAIR